MSRHLVAAVLAACVLLPVPYAAAEDRATVFIHGLASDPSTWDAAASRLAAQLAITPYKPALEWRALYEAQATQLDQRVGPSLPGDAIAVGHSNGGIVARQWSRNRTIGGIVTIGSPNQGAPIVDHLSEWLAFLDDVLIRISNVDGVFSHFVNQDQWWWLPAQWTARFAFGFDVWRLADAGLLSLGVDRTLPVLSEMRVGSPFMANLNGASSRDREAAQVGARVAIVNAAHDFDVGGPFRLIAPDSYGQWHTDILATGIALESLAGVIRITADGNDQGAFDVADELSGVAEWFLEFEEVWCRAVSDPSPLPIARCMEHDGIVPAWSQAYDYPRLPLILRIDGPTHTEETSNSDTQLFQALTTIGQVSLRGAGQTAASPKPPSSSPAPPPPTGRFKWNGSSCTWDANDSGPDQCTPPAPPTGRFKFDGSGSCYWEPNDYPPDQCTPPSLVLGRYKMDGNGGCSWDPNDSGPDQCTP